MTGMDEKGHCNLSAPVFKEGMMPVPLSQEQQVRGADSLSQPGCLWSCLAWHVPTGEHNSAEGWSGLTPPPAPGCRENALRKGVTN